MDFTPPFLIARNFVRGVRTIRNPAVKKTDCTLFDMTQVGDIKAVTNKCNKASNFLESF